ncbi:retention module-containing protein, partial [Marinomonas epiphytica]
MSDNQTSVEATQKPIGYVQINEEGAQVEVTSADGTVRFVEDGGVVYYGDTINANGATGVIIFFDGSIEEVPFGEDSVVEITGEVYDTEGLDQLQEDSVAEAEALQDAILAGEDPTQIQEAPAAGEEAGEFDDGNSVGVDVARNNTGVTTSFGFDTEGGTSGLSLPTFGYDTDNDSGGLYTARVSFSFTGESNNRSSDTDSSDSGSIGTSGDAPSIVFTSYFVDGLVNGLSYTTTSGLSGITGSDGDDGSFNYRDGDTVTFSVGGVVVGSVTSEDIDGQFLFLQDIADTGLKDVNDNYVENMAIFLQAIQEGLADSDTGTSEDDGVLQTNDLVNYDEVSNVISISQETRDALADVNLNIEQMDKEDLSDLLATLGIEFTRDSEAVNGDGDNVFETIAMEHVAENIETFAGDRVPEEFDAREQDVIEFNEGTVTYNYLDVKETGQLTFSASDLANGVTVNQVFSENLAVSNVSLGEAFQGLGELVDNGDGTYTINIAEDKLEGLTPYDLEGLNFDFTVNDWTAEYTQSSSAALDLNKSHLSTNISEAVNEGDDYAQFTLSSSLTFDEAQSLNITFTSETLSDALGKQIAEYADDFSMPFEYSTDGGETWLSATLNSVEFIGDVAWPTFGIELPADASSIDVRIPLFDDVAVEGTEFLEAVITGDNFYDEQISIEIEDNDTADVTVPVVSIDYVYAIEGQEYAEFTVSLSEPSSTDVTIDYDVLGVGATAGEDYENATGTITIPAGQTSAVVQIPIVDDIEVENMEMAFVTLSNVTGDAVLGDMQGSLRIFDNDGESNLNVTLSLDDITEDNILNASEDDATYAVTGRLEGDDFSLAVVSLNINGQTFSVNTTSDGEFTIDVPREVLVSDGDLTIEANAIAYNEAGDKGVATENHSFEINVAPEAEDAVDSLIENEIASGTINVTDTDLVDQGNLTFSVVGTAPAGFSIDESGNYSLDTASYDYLSEAEIQDVLVEDTMGNQDVAQLTFTVTGTNDLPTVEGLSQFILESAVFNGQIDAEDVDVPDGESLTYTLSEEIAGLTIHDDGSYTFDAADYAYLKTGELLNLSTTLTVTDEQGASATAVLTFNVIGISVGAIIAGADVGSVAEDLQSVATGTLTISDADAGEASFVEQSDVSSTFGTFSINENGEWTYNLIDTPTIQGLGVGATLTDTITVTSDGGDTHSVTITINGTNDVPVINAAVGSTLTENLASEGDTVATFTASDLDGDTVTYSITSGNDAGYFSIDEDTGVVTLTAAGALALGNDALTDTDITLGVTASDGTATSDEATVTITLDGVNDAPTIDTATGSTLTENLASEGDTVATFTASDLDGDTVTYSITSGNDAGYFTIDEDTGVVTLTAAGALALGNDALTDTDITLGVTASDGTADSEEQFATISLSSVDDATELAITLGDALVEETTEAGAIVATFAASDEDDTVTVDF